MTMTRGRVVTRRTTTATLTPTAPTTQATTREAARTPTTKVATKAMPNTKVPVASTTEGPAAVITLETIRNRTADLAPASNPGRARTTKVIKIVKEARRGSGSGLHPQTPRRSMRIATPRATFRSSH